MPWNDLSHHIDNLVMMTGCSLNEAVDVTAEEFELSRTECMSRYLQERQSDHGE